MSNIVKASKKATLATAILMAGVALAPLSASAETAKPAAPAAKAAPAPAAAATPAKPETAVKRVTSDKMKAYNDAMAAAKNKNAASHEQMKKLRNQLKTIIAAPSFDKAAFTAKSAEIDALMMQMRKTMTDAMASALGQLSPEERQVVASNPGADRKPGGHRKKK